MEDSVVGSKLRERDKIIEQKYERELQARDAKAEKWKRAYDNLCTELFNERNNSLRLARSLGFETTSQAQLHIENSNNTTYRDCLKQNEETQKGLRELKAEYESKIEALEKENGSLKDEVESHSNRIFQLETEQRLLEERYDQLATAHSEATAKHLREYQRFKKWRRWLYDEDEAEKIGDSKKRTKYAALTYLRRRDRVRALEETANDDSVLDLADFDDISPIKPRKRPSTPLSSRKIRFSSPLTPTTRANVVKRTPKRGLPSLTPPSSALQPPTSPSSVPRHSEQNTKSPKDDFQIPNSSDTEEDTQLKSILTSAIRDNKRLGGPKPHLNQSPSPFSKSPLHTRILPARAQPLFLKRTHPVTPFFAAPSANPFDLESSSPQSSPSPSSRKRRRVSEADAYKQLEDIKDQGKGKEIPEGSKENQKGLSMSVDRAAGSSSWKRSQSSDRAMPPPPVLGPSLVASTSRAPDPGDYSAYKGRGRYARSSSNNQEKTLNELYMIDPDRNEGLNHEFDEVVRGKESRKRLAAGDCEDCQEYYEAIGPMPPRLQQPLWRSPTASPGKKTISCHHRHKQNLKGHRASPPPSPTPDRSRIDSHKQAISRHRFHWAKARTPPGYWDIGFPNTQEAVAINQKAKEMHRQKREQVEKEAMNANGRYKRR
ncbi:hypothetical protein WG66_005024 [Moniliophthora roreri]|uniref:DNA endonuclease activator Ctp1 C-terminal domain-containing protein n=1 Tax=Moniliophthora roreri TaxID=221103 RepID=A0A0W0FSY3_MONRR|nr:hypothetical protein WG66_005024 [Moniliophthora roreri]